MYVVMNMRTGAVAYQGPHSSVAGRKVMALGANPAGWYKVRGTLADAKAVLARHHERRARRGLRSEWEGSNGLD